MRNDYYSVISAIVGLADARRASLTSAYAWGYHISELERVANDFLSSEVAGDRGAYRYNRADERLSKVFEHIWPQDEEYLCRAAAFLSRVPGNLAINAIRHRLPGGIDLYVRDDMSVIREMLFRTSILPTLASIAVEEALVMKAFKKKADEMGVGYLPGGEGDKLIGLMGCVAISKRDDYHLFYYETADEAVTRKMMM